MDNKNDRQFYWQIKDFMGQSHTPPAQPKKKVDVTSVAKNIVEQNKPYKQSSFDANLTSKNTISQAINYITAKEEKNKPSSALIAKNNTSNPFRMVNEGIFDDVVSAASFAVNPIGTTVAKSLFGGYRPRPTSTGPGGRPIMGPRAGQDDAPDPRQLNMQDVQGELQNYEGRSSNQPLTARQRALLDREGQLKGQQDAAEQERREAQQLAGKPANQAPAQPQPTSQGQATAQPTAQPAAQTQAPQQTSGQQDAGQQQANKDALANYGAQQFAKNATDMAFGGVFNPQQGDQKSKGQESLTPVDDEDEKLTQTVMANKRKTYARDRQTAIDKEEDSLTYLKNMDPSKAVGGSAAHAVRIQQAERRLARAKEKEMPTDEKLRGEAISYRKSLAGSGSRYAMGEKKNFGSLGVEGKGSRAKYESDLQKYKEGVGKPSTSTSTGTPASESPATAKTGAPTTTATPAPTGSRQSTAGVQSPRDFNKASMEPGKVYTVSKGGYAQSDVTAPENRPQETQTSSTPAPTQGAQRTAPMPTSEKPVPEPTSGRQSIYPGSMPDIDNQIQTGSEVNTRAKSMANKQKPASAMGSLA